MTAESVLSDERPADREGGEALKTASLSISLEENKLLIILSIICADSWTSDLGVSFLRQETLKLKER